MKSTASNHVYFTSKNKKLDRKLEFKKYDPTPGVQKRVIYKEGKK